MENRNKFLLGAITGAALAALAVEGAHQAMDREPYYKGLRDGVCLTDERGFLDLPRESNFPDDGTHDLHAYLRECGREPQFKR